MIIGKLIGYNEVTKRMNDNSSFSKDPFKLFYSTIDDSDYADYYVDINSIVDINTHWKDIGQYQQIRPMLLTMLLSTIGLNFAGWGTLSQACKEVACKWVCAPYSLRMTVVSDADDIDNFTELLAGTSGIVAANLIGRSRVVEEMRDYVGVNYYRKDLISKSDIDDFFANISELTVRYINSNDPHFIWWINGSNPTATGGCLLDTNYGTQEMVDNLQKIYNGFY